MTRRPPAHTPERTADRTDRGGALILVLVLVVVAGLIVIPIMVYTSTVLRAGQGPIDKQRASQAARGGIWVTLDRGDLYDTCAGSMPSSLDGVTVSCTVVDTATLHDPAEVPFGVATTQADELVPAALDGGNAFVNPNTAADPAAWRSPALFTEDPTVGHVWLPNLPTLITADGDTSASEMVPGTQDPLYPDSPACRVFFPGVYDQPVDISGPAYFLSGVYYFRDAVTLTDGADVVVGGGAEVGCTNDFEAIANAVAVPVPPNNSGWGGTWIFGDEGRLVVDDTGATTGIRLAINQRYVADDELTTLASEGLSIVSVNGNHAPFVGAGDYGQDLEVANVISMPQSRVDDPNDDPDDGSDDPLATDEGYRPSTLTAKPTAPDAPTNVVATPYRRTTPLGNQRVTATVTWDAPNENGALITGYTVTATRLSGPGLPDSEVCTPATPTLPDTAVQNSCTFDFDVLDNNRDYEFTVTATNDVGDTASAASNIIRPNGSGSGGTITLAPPDAPADVALQEYSDGWLVSWTPSVDDGGATITAYTVTATSATNPDVTCTAWWNETSCVLPTGPGGVVDGGVYDIDVVATTIFDDSVAASPVVDPATFTVGTEPAPVQVAAVAGVRVPNSIVDLSLASSAPIEVTFAGYVAVPQGHVTIDAGATPDDTTIEFDGGLTAAAIHLGALPSSLTVDYSNPVAQKRMRIVSTADGKPGASAVAIVQVNESGSFAVNSLLVQ